jgi:hypothetical protein
MDSNAATALGIAWDQAFAGQHPNSRGVLRGVRVRTWNQIQPANSVAPVISGTGTVGQTLTVTNNGTWNPVPTLGYMYQWMRSGTPIGAGTTNSHVLVAADSGKSITCMVVAHSPHGVSTPKTSNAIACA